MTLMNHLQVMGENNAIFNRRTILSRQTILGAAAIYDELFRTEKGLPATFEVIYGIGWVPHPSQPKPAKRGSATMSMKVIAEQVGAPYQVIDEGEKEGDSKEDSKEEENSEEESNKEGENEGDNKKQ